ncbi:MAG TPA: 4-hydroxybutyrate CoA-transferase, partial [Acidobacteria bacterium]|nr:4-hydroxybutyrate CoA-transferase [Acidobacteriota bacterium]
QQLYDFLDNNPMIEAHPCDYVNDPFVVSQNENMVAINSAIEIDLTGQICSDSIGPRIYSGFGGQVDFIRGAAKARGGKPVIALPSTARKGQQSRIVPFLQKGAGVVTTRADVHYVVTEWGIAHLFGKNLRERCEALIQIAHPDFRADLETAARERGIFC